MPTQDNRSAPTSATLSLFKDVGPQKLDALAGECWLIHRDKDARLSTLINATRGGRLTFEELAEAMWNLGFVAGTRTVISAVEGRLAEASTEPKAGPS